MNNTCNLVIKQDYLSHWVSTLPMMHTHSHTLSLTNSHRLWYLLVTGRARGSGRRQLPSFVSCGSADLPPRVATPLTTICSEMKGRRCFEDLRSPLPPLRQNLKKKRKRKAPYLLGRHLGSFFFFLNRVWSEWASQGHPLPPRLNLLGRMYLYLAPYQCSPQDFVKM